MRPFNLLIAFLCLLQLRACQPLSPAFSFLAGGIKPASQARPCSLALRKWSIPSVIRQAQPVQIAMVESSTETKQYFESIAATLATSRTELELDEDEVWVDMGKHIGAGTYGDVFEAVIVRGPRKGMRAVAKRAKTKMLNAQLFNSGDEAKGSTAAQLHQAWHEVDEALWEAAPAFLKVESYINDRCATLCPKVVAPYLGTVELRGSQWLLWAHIGAACTLEHVLEACHAAGSLKPLARELGVREFRDNHPQDLRDLVNEAARQLLRCCAELQRAGIAHRDIKPANLIVAQHQLRLIDFGSAAVMGDFPMVGYNYSEAPCDIKYCPPERFIDELEWTKYDVYCVALILLRMLMPPMLEEGGYEAFRESFQGADNDIDKWFATLILEDPMIQTVQGRKRSELPDFGLPRLSGRIKEYERLAGVSCVMRYDDEPESRVPLSLCPLKEGLAALSNDHVDGLVWDTLHSMLQPEPSLRPSAEEALRQLDGSPRRGSGAERGE